MEYEETLVRTPIKETEDQRKEREKRGELLPHVEYTAVTVKKQGKQ